MAFQRAEVQPSVRRELWRRSLGMCQLCRIDLDPGTKGPSPTAETAHIIALSDGGTRADPALPIEERNRIENLLSLCPSCHDIIDKDQLTYTYAALVEAKSAHEAWAEELRHAGRSWSMRYASVDYINLPRLAMMAWADRIQELARKSGLQVGRSFRGQGSAPGIFVGRVAPILSGLGAHAVPMERERIESLEVGCLTSFNTRVRSMNPPSQPPRRITGKLKRDPHLRFQLGDRKVLIRYDPSWLTTSTASSDLHFAAREPANYAGIGRIAAITKDEVHLSAWIFGRPQTAEGAALQLLLTSPDPLPRTIAIDDFGPADDSRNPFNL